MLRLQFNVVQMQRKWKQCKLEVYCTSNLGKSTKWKGLLSGIQISFRCFFIKNWAFVVKERNLIYYSKVCLSHCFSCVWHGSWSNNASNSAFSYTFGLPLRSFYICQFEPKLTGDANFWQTLVTYLYTWYFCMNNKKKWGIFNKKSISYNRVASVIGPQMKKPTDIAVNTGTSHSNTKKEEGSLAKGTKSSVYWNREQNFRKYFHFDQELSLVYCMYVNGLINELKPGVYKDGEWRLFIDSSKRSLKAVLLRNTN